MQSGTVRCEEWECQIKKSVVNLGSMFRCGRMTKTGRVECVGRE